MLPHVEIADIDAEEPVAASRDVAALVSPAVSERVAQSFGALAQAMDAGPRRSFDEIAGEMLRPMLQEWLDDNLPTLVERLVREEIERVARGPRR
jgi:cell pole-organizing protein PopZ